MKIVWHLWMGWLFNQAGNIFYKLNGGLDGLEKKNTRQLLMYRAWGNAFHYYDKVTGIKYFRERV